MKEVKVPSPGESMSEVDIASWTVADGDYVTIDDVIAEIDSDKATLELTATASGTISLNAEEGDTVEVGQVVAEIDTSAEAPAGNAAPKEDTSASSATDEKAPEPKAAALKEEPVAQETSHASGHPSPSAKKAMAENNISANQVSGTGKGGRITKQDVVNAMAVGIPAESDDV